MATYATTQIGQAQQGLEADYYQMEAWETSSDDVSGSGNLNYQEVELKLDKDMVDFGTGFENVDDSEPALMRSKAVEEASFFTQGDSALVGEMAHAGPSFMMDGGFASSPLADIQNFNAPPVVTLENDAPIARAANNFNPPDTSTANGPVTTISSEDGTTITNIYNGCCDGGNSITINVDAPITNIINVIVDVINIGDIIDIGGDIINIDLGGGGDGGITINPDIDINIGDIINTGINVIVDLGDTINIGGDVNLEVIGIDVDTDIDLGLGDGGLNLGIDLGVGDLPLLGDALEELTSIDFGIGDGVINLDASIIGGDLLDLGLDLGEDGLGLDTGIGLPPLLGLDGLSLLDIDLDLGDGLGLDTDLLGEDLLDLGLLGEDGLDVSLLGQDLLGSDDPVSGILDGVTDTVDDLLGGVGGGDDPVGGVLDGVTDTVGDLIGGVGGGDDPVGGVLDGVTDTVDDLLGGVGSGDDPLGGVLDGLGDALDGGGELLDVELLNDDGALLDVDLLGDDLIGDGGLLGDVTGQDGILDGVTDDLGGTLDLVDLELGGSDDGGLLSDLDLGGGDILDVDLLGDGLLDADLAGSDLIGGEDPVGGLLDGVGDVLGGDGGLLGGLTTPVPDVLPDTPDIPILGGLFGGLH